MAHFARVKNGWVHEVIVAEQDYIDSVSHSTDGSWVQTSYNTRGGIHYTPDSNTQSTDQSKALRYNYASKGMRYDRDGDAFYDQQPYSSWTLNKETYIWEAPVAYQSDGELYDWNEDNQAWDALTE